MSLTSQNLLTGIRPARTQLKLVHPSQTVAAGWRAFSTTKDAIHFGNEYRPANRNHCGVGGGGDDGAFLLFASASRCLHRARWQRSVSAKRHPTTVHIETDFGVAR